MLVRRPLLFAALVGALSLLAFGVRAQTPPADPTAVAAPAAVAQGPVLPSGAPAATRAVLLADATPAAGPAAPAGPTVAANAVPPIDTAADPTQFLGMLVQAIEKKEWGYLLGLGLCGLLYLFHRFGPGWPWTRTDLGGLAISLGVPTFTAMAIVLCTPNAHVTWAIIWAALKVGAGGVTVFVLLKKGVVPLLELLAKKFPKAAGWIGSTGSATTPKSGLLGLLAMVETFGADEPAAAQGVAPAAAPRGVVRPEMLAVLLTVALCIALFFAWEPRNARADNGTPGGDYGYVTLASTTATVIGGSVRGRNSLGICNLDTAIVWLGTDASVTNANGWPLYAGGCASVPAGWLQPGQKDVYGYSVAGQSASTNVRWIESR